MKVMQIFEAGTGFKVLETTERSQTGLLTLEPGEASSEEPSRHAESDQVLIVLQGSLRAEIGEESEEMWEGDAVLVPAKTPHKFINAGNDRAITFSVYAGPAFPPEEKSNESL